MDKVKSTVKENTEKTNWTVSLTDGKTEIVLNIFGNKEMANDFSEKINTMLNG